MTIQAILKKKFMGITNNDMDAETLANALFDKVIDKLPSDLLNEEAEEKVTIALTEVLFEELVNK